MTEESSQWEAFRRRWRWKSKVANAARACFMEGPAFRAPSKHGAALLAELRAFCRADATCVIVGKDGHIDTHATMVAEGRREVWTRLQELLELDDQAVREITKEANDA